MEKVAIKLCPESVAHRAFKGWISASRQQRRKRNRFVASHSRRNKVILLKRLLQWRLFLASYASGRGYTGSGRQVVGAARGQNRLSLDGIHSHRDCDPADDQMLAMQQRLQTYEVHMSMPAIAAVTNQLRCFNAVLIRRLLDHSPVSWSLTEFLVAGSRARSEDADRSPRAGLPAALAGDCTARRQFDQTRWKQGRGPRRRQR